MRRKLFSFAAMLSLLLCLGTVAVWGLQTGAGQRGEIHFGNAALGRMTVNREGWYYVHAVSASFPDLRDREWGGFRMTVIHTFGRVPQYLSLDLPHWFVAGVASVLPAAWLVKRKLSKKKAGLCAGCGYSLTGNVSGVCPECGTKIGRGKGVGS